MSKPPPVVRSDPWFIVRVATRQENRAMASMRHAKLTCFFPSRAAWSHAAREPIKKAYPLFAGYAFVQIPEGPRLKQATNLDGLYDIANLDGVVGFVWVPRPTGDRRAATLPRSEVEALIVAEVFGLFDETWKEPWRPEKGELVQVVDGGPMHGFVGKVVKVKGANRIKVLFDHLGASNMDVSQVQAPDVAPARAA